MVKHILPKSQIKKRILLWFISIIIIFFGALTQTHALSKPGVPSFDDSFSKYLTQSETVDPTYGKETVFNLCIDRNISLMQNMRRLLYPNFIKPQTDCNISRGWLLWDLIKIVWFIALFVMIVFAGINLLMSGDNEETVKKTMKSFIYILYGAFLIFGSIRLLGSILNVENLTGTAAFAQKLQWWPDSLFFQILWFFKMVVFFLAIVMIIVYAFQIMASMDQEEKIKKWQKGVLNVIIALFLIKIIDYIFFIAQAPEFAAKATDLIIQIAKLMGYFLWAGFIVLTFYSGFLLLTSGWNEENFKKVKNIFITIFLSSIVIFLFLLITYQIFHEFS